MAEGREGVVAGARISSGPSVRAAPLQGALWARGDTERITGSFLRRKQPGVYEGTESNERVTCLAGDRTRQTARFRIKIVAAEAGEAPAIEGSVHFKSDCGSRRKFYGERRT